MQIRDLLIKYKDVQPKDFGSHVERCYPVGTVVSMLEEQKQALQQTACYTALELLQQMVGERSLANAFNSDYHLKQKNYSEIDALRFVMELIKEHPANAV